jgi:ABC-type phosphate transport system permease subunit
MSAGFQELAAKNPSAVASFDPAKLKEIQNNSSLIKTLPADIQNTVLNAFVDSFHVVFLVAAPVVAVGFFVALFLRETPLRTNADYAAAREEAAGEALG